MDTIALSERQLLEAAPDAMVVVDSNGHIVRVNRRMETLFGYSRSQLLGQAIEMLLPERFRDAHPQHRQKFNSAPRVRTMGVGLPLYGRRNDGTEFPIDVSLSPIESEQGSFIVTAIRDASVHKQYEKNLLGILETSLNEIYIFEAFTLQLLQVNKGARRNLGYTIEELRELTPVDFKTEYTTETFEQLISPLRNGKEPINFVTTHRRKDGSEYPVEVQLQHTAFETMPVFVAIVKDITERQRKDEHLKLRDRAIEAVDVGVSITDASQAHHPLVYVNQALCTMTGYKPAELIGKGVRVLQKNNSHQPAHLHIQQAQDKGEAVQVLLKSTRKDGTEYMDELSLSPVHNAAGKLTHYIGINRDVTSKLDAQARLHRSRKMEAIGQLSGGIAHDFNNVLSVIIGNLEFLANDTLDDDQQEFLNEASNAAKMGARLTRRLLAFAKRSQLEPVELDVNEQVLNSVALLRATVGEIVSLSADLIPDLWTIRVDPSEFENAIVNLAINARDAMPNGGGINIKTDNVTLSNTDIEEGNDLSPGDYVKLSVSDSGTGMTASVKRRMFEPFFTTKEDSRGTGLGLSSIYGFVKQSGGHISVISEVGQGTMIHIWLPRYAETAVQDQPKKQAGSLSTQSKARVLVVEDHDMVRKVTVKRLRVLGFDTEQVCNGPEAVKQLENDANFDLVLTDIVMDGGMSGFDVVKWVQKHQHQCKVLLTSGFNDQMTDTHDIDAESLKVLQKPYDLTELRRAVNEALNS